MQKIALPKNINFEAGDDPNQSKIIIEPCYPGYGITIGNSLRRVLLSSLPGAAVIGVKIEGIDHEFMTLPNLKEDILEFILNLKKLRLKVFTDEVIKLELSVHGKKEITAGDITKNSEVEIANPELVLGDITEMSGSINAEIFVSRGMGYKTIESREENKEKEINYIEMDSIFSPVIATGVKLDNIRVGKMTNWEKLVLDVTTDGTITPKEAFKQSVTILIDQFSALDSDKRLEEEETEEKGKEEIVEEEEKKDENEEEEVEEKKKRGRPKKDED